MPPKDFDPLDTLLSARVAVIAGKGGVGKTTVTAVLARAAFLAGRRVLVVELDGKDQLSGLVGTPGPDLMSLSASAALREYLDTHGLSRVSRRLVSAGVIDVVATAAPGIDDIVVLGKVKQLERRGEYDLIVVDGPAAGHAITMLSAAAGLRRSTRGGPVRAQADDVADMLADHRRSQVVLVTLPETTPVNEAVDTAYALEDEVGVRLGMLIVNAVDHGTPLEVDEHDTSAEHRAASFRNARRSLQRAELQRLDEVLALPRVELPAVPAANLDARAIDRLAHTLLPTGAAFR
jgi:anion-transporting  ArsA/GET3 family ATPase